MKIFQTINPYDGSVINEYKSLSVQQVDIILQESQQAFLHWKKTSFQQRTEVLKKAALILRRDKDMLAKLITLEMGKVITEAKAEIEKCAFTLDYYAENGEAYLKNIIINSSASYSSYIAFDPIGTIFAIMPWNYPFWQVIRYAAPCLLSGNVTLLKHAPNVFGCAKAIEKIFVEAGAFQGVFQNVIIDVDVVEQIIAHSTVQGVTLTGSERAGSQVAMLAGKYIKKAVMELGGSDSFIVLADADLEKAVKVAVNSRMMNAGQACICAKRFIIQETIKDAFQDAFLQEIKKIKIGNPLSEDVNMGPMARLDLAQKVEKQTQESLQKGAHLLIGGNREDCFYMPALLTNITKGMAVYEEEVFGPLASLIVAKNEQEAVAIANYSAYGLGTAIWTKDLEKAQHLARTIEAGAVFVNAIVHSDPRLPFGGIKKSGFGRELSEVGIKEFMNIKTIYVNQ
ncbi:putative succinate-semialdehyde dehydrogenase [NADP(+)] [Rhinoderma darwinii]|uniref:putative succinate-semialdehyde dehydrogenase [NADP(+)] n=1 Tax=Rhinoderma darwinii TaxID=43563 RepID=UPI003F66657E